MSKTLDDFAKETLGGSYGNPGTGTYKGQCVSYVRLYIEEVLGIKTGVWGNAVDYWTNPRVLEYFDRSVSPSEGAIPVWGDDAGSWTGPEGHIGIIYQGQLLNQNFGGSLKVTINRMFTQGLLGYLKRKETSLSKPTYEEVLKHFRTFTKSDPTEDQMNYYVQRDWGTLNGDILQFVFDRYTELQEKAAGQVPSQSVAEKQIKSIKDVLGVK